MNILFDLGGVILEWNPEDLLNRVFSREIEKESIRTHLLHHNDWKELDRGTLTKAEAVDRTVIRTGLPADEVEQFLSLVPGSLEPMPAGLTLVDDLKSKGYPLFVLSNMHLESTAHLKENIDFLHLFEDFIFSSDIKMIKPEPEIFLYAVRRFNIEASDTVFIDDSLRNIEEANKLGFKTILCRSIQQVRKELKEMKILL